MWGFVLIFTALYAGGVFGFIPEALVGFPTLHRRVKKAALCLTLLWQGWTIVCTMVSTCITVRLLGKDPRKLMARSSESTRGSQSGEGLPGDSDSEDDGQTGETPKENSTHELQMPPMLLLLSKKSK